MEIADIAYVKKLQFSKTKRQQQPKKKGAPSSFLVRLAQDWSKVKSSIPLSIIAADRRAAASKNS
ncbi:hypothetical protein WDW86_00470 [Bdellovibrionota bacterium FG-2]